MNTTEIIKQIHSEFYTSSEPIGNQIENKAQRLKDLGFVAAIKTEMIDRDALMHFSRSYPLHKFITIEKVNSICEKYGLVLGPINKYKGEIPDRNILEMEAFKIKDKDRPDEYSVVSVIASYTEMEKMLQNGEITKDYMWQCIQGGGLRTNIGSYHKSPFEIVAPVADFDTKGMQLKKYKLSEIPDPIVLCPVQYNGIKYYAIVTAWGIEAKDVSNELFN